MTLTATTNKVQYNGDDSTVSFPITFVYWLNADIKVILTDVGGTDINWVEGTQYTLTGGEGFTGTLTVDVDPNDYTPLTGEVLTIKSDLPDTQDTSLPLGGAFPSTEVEERFDKNVRLTQQRSEELGRAVQLNETSLQSDVNIADPVTGEYLRWDANGDIESTPLVTTGAATGVDETDTNTTKDKLTSNNLAKVANDVAAVITGTPVASAVNKLEINNNTTGNNPQIQAIGTDAAVGINFTAKGNTSQRFLVNGSDAFGISTGGVTPVNYLVIRGQATTLGPTIGANGTDTDIDIRMIPKGLGVVKLGFTDQAAGVPMLRGYIDGLTIANDAGDTTNDISIEPGFCVDSANAIPMTLTTTITKQIDITGGWVVGNDTAGFPSGLTLTNDTWYHIFVIKRTDTGVVDAGFDTSTTATNLLSDATNYDAYRRIGSIRRETAANKLISAYGGRVFYEVWPLDTNPATGNLTLMTPPDVRCIAHMVQDVSTPNAASGYSTLRPNVGSSTINTGGGFQGTGTASGDTGQFVAPIDVLTDTSSRIHNNDGSGSLIQMYLMGYTDFRGRE